MITASKPKISRPGPLAGSKLVRMPRKMPAMATTASDSAMAMPEDMRLVQPHELGNVLIVRNRAEGTAQG